MSSLANLRTYLCADIIRDPNHRIWSSDTVDRAINNALSTLQQDLMGFLPATETPTTFTLV